MFDSLPGSPRCSELRDCRVSDAEMGETGPGAREDAHHVMKVLRRVSGGFGSS